MKFLSISLIAAALAVIVGSSVTAALAPLPPSLSNGRGVDIYTCGGTAGYNHKGVANKIAHTIKLSKQAAEHAHELNELAVAEDHRRAVTELEGMYKKEKAYAKGGAESHGTTTRDHLEYAERRSKAALGTLALRKTLPLVTL